jgi:hypothetical protein
MIRPGDPTVIGWTTFGLYILATLHSVARSKALKATEPDKANRWTSASRFLLAFGINKQVDAQTFLIRAGRKIAEAHGLMGSRNFIYTIFFILLCLTSIVVVYVFSNSLISFSRDFPMAMTGFILVVLYVAVRTVAITHISEQFGVDWDSISWLWTFEVSGLLLIVAQPDHPCTH